MFNFKLSHVKWHALFSYPMEFILGIPFPCLPITTPFAIPNSEAFQPSFLAGREGEDFTLEVLSLYPSRACSLVSLTFPQLLFWTFFLLFKSPSPVTIPTSVLEEGQLVQTWTASLSSASKISLIATTDASWGLTVFQGTVLTLHLI